MNNTSTPIDKMPEESAFSSMYPERRVSLPSTILCRPRLRACVSSVLNTWPAARPSLSAVSAVTGSMLAVPRTPSVPKIFFGEVIWVMARWKLECWCDGGLTLGKENDLDFRRFNGDMGDTGGRGNIDAFAHIMSRL